MVSALRVCAWAYICTYRQAPRCLNDVTENEGVITLSMPVTCTLNNVAGLRVTDVNIDEDGRVGNLTVVEGCVFLESETGLSLLFDEGASTSNVVQVKDSTFMRNKALIFGGGVCIIPGNFTVQMCRFIAMFMVGGR